MNQEQSGKFTKLERHWIGYDIGNSAFTLLVTVILPLIFNGLAKAADLSETTYLAYWGYGVSSVTLIVMLLGPTLGAIADNTRRKRQIFLLSVIFGIGGMILLSFPLNWLAFLIAMVVARIGYQASLIFYDAMLPDITTPDRMDKVSSYGFALGYIGSCIPFVLSIAVFQFKDKIGISQQLAVAAIIVINAIWWLAFTLPLARSYQQPYGVDKGKVDIGAIFRQLGQTLKETTKNRKLFFFMVAFFFYIDGVYTIINMATAYGQSLGLDSMHLLLALLVTQIVAFPCAILFGILAKKYQNSHLIMICIVAYTAIALFALQLDTEWKFWVLAICVGIFQGGIQALSRSYFAKLIPQEKSGEYFGLYDIFGKGAALTGSFLVGLVSDITDKQQLSIVPIVIMFIIGFVFFWLSAREPASGQNFN